MVKVHLTVLSSMDTLIQTHIQTWLKNMRGDIHSCFYDAAAVAKEKKFNNLDLKGQSYKTFYSQNLWIFTIR